MSNTLNIAVDVGYGFIKTAPSNILFPSGLKKVTMAPPLNQKVIKYRDHFYLTGIEEDGIDLNRQKDESLLVITLAAIACELKQAHITKADIRLAVGVPLIRVGTERKNLQQYYDGRFTYMYENEEYQINIVSVDVFPQGYTGILPYLSTLKSEGVIVDIGTRTTDILKIKKNGDVDMECSNSVPKGVNDVINEVNKLFMQKYDFLLEPQKIRQIIMDQQIAMESKYEEDVKRILQDFANEIWDKLGSLQFNLILDDFYFIGGGATLMKNYFKGKKDNVHVIEDIFINANGYLLLLNQKYKGE